MIKMTLHPSDIYRKLNRIYKENYSLIQTKVYNPFSVINDQATIILGNQKSGTTAIAKLLGIATAKEVTSDYLAFRGNNDLFPKLINEEISFKDFLSQSKWESSREIIKDPDFTFLYPQVKEVFIKTPKVFIVRHPEENIRSILNRHNVSGKGNIRPTFSHVTNPAWRRVLEGSSPKIEGKTVVEVLAKRWRMAARVLFDHTSEMIIAKYEEFVSDKKQFIEKLAASLQLNVVENIDPWLEVQFQPRGKRMRENEEFFDEENKLLIKEICQEYMSQLGYI